MVLVLVLVLWRRIVDWWVGQGILHSSICIFTNVLICTINIRFMWYHTSWKGTHWKELSLISHIIMTDWMRPPHLHERVWSTVICLPQLLQIWHIHWFEILLELKIVRNFSAESWLSLSRLGCWLLGIVLPMMAFPSKTLSLSPSLSQAASPCALHKHCQQL